MAQPGDTPSAQRWREEQGYVGLSRCGALAEAPMREMDLRRIEFSVDTSGLLSAFNVSPGSDAIETLDLTAYRRMQQLYCYLLWPADAARRQAMAARFWQKARRGWHKAGTDPARSRLEQMIQGWFRYAVAGCFEESFKIEGGFDADQIEQNEITAALRDACLAGRTLAMMEAISRLPSHQGRASKNKAIHVMESAGLGKSSKIYTAWKTHKSVAHLASALSAMIQLQHAGLVAADIESEVNATLAIARQFQEFAAHLIGADEIWRVPASLELPPCEPVCFQLTEAMIRALAGYRAPQ